MPLERALLALQQVRDYINSWPPHPINRTVSNEIDELLEDLRRRMLCGRSLLGLEVILQGSTARVRLDFDRLTARQEAEVIQELKTNGIEVELGAHRSAEG